MIMNPKYETIFTEDPGNKTMHVSREFNAPPDLVWRCWTEAELLDKWWAPQPWKTITKHMDFREGGSWLYCMQGPNEGEKHWGRTDYHKIEKKDFFDADDSFCDENGTVNTELPGTKWHVVFTATGTGTRVETTTTFASAEALRKLVEMGVKEGTRMAHENLDSLLKELRM